MTSSLLNLAALQATPLEQHPYPYLLIENFIAPSLQLAINETFPPIQDEGSFPLSAFQLTGAMAELIQELNGEALRDAIATKFSIDLKLRPTTITLRGFCTPGRDGKIHTDSKDKLITVLLYLGADEEGKAGRLRILYDKQNIDHYAAEISPDFGNAVMFRVTEHGWHGFKPVRGQRRAIQLNYVVSSRIATKNIWRHKLAAFFKRLRRGR